MIIDFPSNPFRRVWNVIRFGFPFLLVITVYSSLIYVLHEYDPTIQLAIPPTPLSVLGVGLSIFLGFKNKAAYDRWWEARIIWGGIVNESRSFGMQVMTLLQPGEKANKKKLRQLQKELIYRHVAWLNALTLQLRKQQEWDLLKPYLSEEEFNNLKKAKNKVTQLNLHMGTQLQSLMEQKLIDRIHYLELLQTLKTFYNLQGKCERIKNTPMPRYYSYFNQMFLYLFCAILPFTLLDKFGVFCVFLSAGLGLAFWAIEASGRITADPFENRSTDTPMTALSRTIEIDMRQQLGETEEELPPPITPHNGILM